MIDCGITIISVIFQTMYHTLEHTHTRAQFELYYFILDMLSKCNYWYWNGELIGCSCECMLYLLGKSLSLMFLVYSMLKLSQLFTFKTSASFLLHFNLELENTISFNNWCWHEQLLFLWMHASQSMNGLIFFIFLLWQTILKLLSELFNALLSKAPIDSWAALKRVRFCLACI